MKEFIDESIPIKSKSEYSKLTEFLLGERGFNLSSYKKSHILRRVSSRLAATYCNDITEYICLLKKKPEEVSKLYDALTVNVSSFFRNREVFDFLEKRIIPEIIDGKVKNKQSTINVWSLGCSTGEEPYSVAILLQKRFRLKLKLRKLNVMIKATDIDSRALEIAREGIYLPFKLEGIDSKIVHSCFNRVGGKYQVLDSLRNMVEFQSQDILDFKPIDIIFDLILCRNMLIYMNKENHYKSYNYFFNHLSADGYLILGKTDAMYSQKTNYFRDVSLENRVYQKTRVI